MSVGGIGAYLFKSKCSWLNLLKSKLIVIISWAVLAFFFTGLWNGAMIIQHEIASVAVVVLILDQLNSPRIINLENKILNYIGKVSFGIYVFHPVILILFIQSIGFDNTKTSPVTVGIFSIILVPLITFLVSHLSYKYFESPFLKLKNKFQVIKA
jgi:peptidoglycan/LPS O-acetylase OafA/YrhL